MENTKQQSDLKNFKFTGRGHFFEMAAVVVAENESEARELLHGYLCGCGLKDDCIKSVTPEEIKPGVVYFRDGDYD